MTRPKKQTVDYFPHLCTHGKTIFIIEQRYGNDGYAFWFKLLECLGNSEGHYLDLNIPAQLEYLRSLIRREECFVFEICDLLSRLEAIDSQLWDSSKVIWCQNFVDNIADVYTKNRHKQPPTKPINTITTQENPAQQNNYAGKAHVEGSTTQINPQRKVKESKGNNIPSKEGISSAETSDASSRPLFAEAPPEVSPETPSEETRCPHDQIIKLYREILPELPAVQEWTKERQALLRARWKEKMERQSLEWWRQYFVRIRGSDFLMGRTDNGFVCNLEWLIRPKNMPKVLEGNYANRKGNGDGRRQYFGAGTGKVIGTAGLARSDTEPYPVDYEF